MLSCGIVNMIADYQEEHGDARFYESSYMMWSDKVDKREYDEKETWAQYWVRLRETGKLSQTIITVVYLLINIVVAVESAVRWFDIVLNCTGTGCVSGVGPLAKMFGQLLNLNCSLLLIPVLKGVLHW